MRRREFVTLIGGAAAVARPLAARAQQPAMPVIGFIRDGSAQGEARWVGGFQKGLGETGYVEGKNVTVEYHWLEGKYDRLPELLADLVRRQVAVIATLSTLATQAAKAATVTIPIVFLVGADPVELGLVESFAKPGGNVTGISVLTSDVVAKRLRLLHDLLPNAARIAVLVDPNNATITEATVQDVQKAAPTMGLQTQIINATTVGEINEVFAAFERERALMPFLLLPTHSLLPIHRPVAVIVGNLVAAFAAKAASTTVPIVFATGTDPVKDGLVTNLNRPGGNVTGVSFFAAAVGAKRLEQLRQLVPSATTIGVLESLDNPEDRKDVEVAARAIGQQLIVLSASNSSEIQAAFETFVPRGVGALIVTSSAFTFSHRDEIVALAARYRLPASYGVRENATAGGSDKLRGQHYRCLSPSRCVRGSDSQGREAGRSAGRTVHQIRVRD